MPLPESSATAKTYPPSRVSGMTTALIAKSVGKRVGNVPPTGLPVTSNELVNNYLKNYDAQFQSKEA